MCQSLPEITGDDACVCARSARVSVFECTRVFDVCGRVTARKNTETAAAAAYELMNTERYVRNL